MGPYFEIGVFHIKQFHIHNSNWKLSIPRALKMIHGAKRKERLTIIIILEREWEIIKRKNILFTQVESLAIFIKR